MISLTRSLHLPANETQKTFVIVVCVLVMSVMAMGLLWQAEIIANQQQAIRWLEGAKFGG
jgi:hypothetical protein